MAKGGGAGTKAGTKGAAASAGTPASLQDFRKFPDQKDDPGSGAWLEAEWKDWADSLTPSEKSAISAYQQAAYTINMKLVSGELLSPYEEHHVKTLDAAIARGRVPANIVVYRGMGMSKMSQQIRDNPRILEGKSFQFANHLSTSLNRATGEHFAPNLTTGMLWRIRVPAGTKGVAPRASAYSRQHASSYTRENEVLLGRGTRVKIHSVKKRKDGSYLVDASITR